MAGTGLLHVPCRQRRDRAARPTFDIHFQPQLRWTAGAGGADASGEPRYGRGGGHRRRHHRRTAHGGRLMQEFSKLSAVAAPLLRENIEQDIVIPISRMVGNFSRGNLGQWCFSALRYQPDGSENPLFILNRAPYRGAEILLTGANFGCGSSREAAVWALQEMGVRCLIGSSFGDIFFNNCFQNGLLPVLLDRATVESMARELELSQGSGRISVDLTDMSVTAPSGKRYAF